MAVAWYAPLLEEFPTLEDANARCPRRELHDVVDLGEGRFLPPRPRSYAALFDWFAMAGKTHAQVRCEGCGRYLVWVPRAEGVEYDEIAR